MKLCTFSVGTPVGEVRRVGVATPAGVVDGTAARVAYLERTCRPAVALRVGMAQVPPDMIEVIGAGPVGREWLEEAVSALMSSGQPATVGGQKTLYELADIRLLAPVPRPPGMSNFSAWTAHIEHAQSKGVNLGVPRKDLGPKSYWKGNADSFVGPGVVLEYPSYAQELDVECEVVAIVGTGGKDLSLEQAEKAIAGYSIFNDVSIRHIQLEEMKSNRGPSKGKDHDGGNVLGPWLVTSDEVGDPMDLQMSLIVNNDQWSTYTAREMAFSFPQMLSYLSRGQTIHPGHVLTAGSYPGGSGFDLERTLHPGDVIELKVSKLGSLINKIGRKPTAAA